MSSSDTLILPTPEFFPAFPYPQPYTIQVELMRHLYEAIERKKVTVVESPTGTGKTSSLLCASLTWLHDEKHRARKGKLDNAATGDDWVSTQTRDRLRRELEVEELEYERKLADARRREAQLSKARVRKKPKLDDKPCQPIQEDSSFLPENNDDLREEDGMNLSPAVRALMARMNPQTPDEEPQRPCTKIYYASRTHSQLTQVLPELGKLKIPGSTSISSLNPISEQGVPYSLGKRKVQDNHSLSTSSVDQKYYQSRALSLGSRKHLCINDELRARARDIDEGCRELLAGKKENRCLHLPPVGEEMSMNEFRDQILATPKDIEDLALAGRASGVCPYFASRKAVPQAELITLPYNLLLQKSAREALGIDLKDQIVIVDEGHNLIPTLLSLSTVHISLPLLQTALCQVTTYVIKFRNRLNPANLVQLKRLLAFLDALAKFLEEWRDKRVLPLIDASHPAPSKFPSTKNEQKVKPLEVQEVLTPAELAERMGRKVVGLNMLEIVKYLKKSKIARKISGYADKLTEDAEKEKELEVTSADSKKKMSIIRKGVVPPLHAIEDLMIALAGATDDGRVSITVTNSSNPSLTSSSRSKPHFSVEIKYHLLNPAPHFRDVMDDARTVIIAGGTMSPISDVHNQLFSHLPPERITSFSCGHIIPSENVLTVAVSQGPSGRQLDFKAGKQGDPAVLADLGQIILNFTRIVPGGMIVFFPSYKFLETAKSAWASATEGGGYLEKFGVKKKVFFEPEDQAEVESVLQQYATAVVGSPASSQTGALLLAVIGAKLSEGLNFADDLARAVVVVGLPFANLASAELRERMRYVKREQEKRLKEVSKENNDGVQRQIVQKGKDAAAELYENLCMNAVNQSIGRAIRHRNDWAALLLLDQRYSNPSIQEKLPRWLGGDNLFIAAHFGGVVKEMGAFFRGKGR